MLTIRHYFIIVGLLICDQVSKWLFELNLNFYDKIVVVPKILTIELVHNYGAAYGIFQNQTFFLLSVSTLVILGVIVFRKKIIQSNFSLYAVVFLLAGAIGNVIDRARLGYVIDFINIQIFPVFNFADIYINIAVILFVIEMIIDEKKRNC